MISKTTPVSLSNRYTDPFVLIHISCLDSPICSIISLNGIIYNQGIIKKIRKRKKGIEIFIKSNLRLSKKDIGTSISCDGVCLTMMNLNNHLLEFYLIKQVIQIVLFILLYFF